MYKRHLYYEKKLHITNLLDNSKNRASTLYKYFGPFAKPENNNSLPEIRKGKLPDDFANYFLNKIEKNQRAFQRKKKCSPPIRPCCKLQDFKPLTQEQVLTLIQDMNYTICTMDPCSTKFIMKSKNMLIMIITKISIISLTTGKYLDEWKIAVIRPLIKRPNLDTECKNYHPNKKSFLHVKIN